MWGEDICVDSANSRRTSLLSSELIKLSVASIDVVDDLIVGIRSFRVELKKLVELL